MSFTMLPGLLSCCSGGIDPHNEIQDLARSSGLPRSLACFLVVVVELTLIMKSRHLPSRLVYHAPWFAILL